MTTTMMLSTKEKQLEKKKKREEAEKLPPAAGFKTIVISEKTYNRYMLYRPETGSFDEIATNVLNAFEKKRKPSSIAIKDTALLRYRDYTPPTESD